MRAMLDFLFLPLYVTCRDFVSEPHQHCSRCLSETAFIEGVLRARCGTPLAPILGALSVRAQPVAKPGDFARASALLGYDKASKRLILAFKRRDRVDHAQALALGGTHRLAAHRRCRCHRVGAAVSVPAVAKAAIIRRWC
jgi:predicted amidophosphoribosyltransferase